MVSTAAMTAMPSMVPVINDRRRSTAAGWVWALVNADLRVGGSARRRLGRPAAGWAVPELTSTPDIPQHHEAQQRGRGFRPSSILADDLTESGPRPGDGE